MTTTPLTQDDEAREQLVVRLLGRDTLSIMDLVKRTPGKSDPYWTGAYAGWTPDYTNVYSWLESARRKKLVDRKKDDAQKKNVYWAVNPTHDYVPPVGPPPSPGELVEELRNSKLPTTVRQKIRERREALRRAHKWARVKRVGDYQGIPLFAEQFAHPQKLDLNSVAEEATRGASCLECGLDIGHAEGCRLRHPAYWEDDETLYVRGDLHERAVDAAVDGCMAYEHEEATALAVKLKPDEYTETDAEDGVPYWKVEFNL